jgi:hypothetical protein
MRKVTLANSKTWLRMQSADRRVPPIAVKSYANGRRWSRGGDVILCNHLSQLITSYDGAPCKHLSQELQLTESWRLVKKTILASWSYTNSHVNACDRMLTRNAPSRF